jgi:Ser/Thr protein kinase RdoA (MazF antagonist)
MDTAQIDTMLGHWELAPLREWTTVKDGVVFEVVTEDGARFMLKDRGDLDGWWWDRLPFEHDVTSHLDRCGVPVAVLLETRDGEPAAVVDGRACSLSPALRNHPTSLTRDESPTFYRNCGRAIARMHRALATYPADGLQEKTWRTDLHDRMLTTCIPYLREHLPEPMKSRLSRLIGSVESDMARAYRDLPEQLIFWDCHPGNTVRDGPEITGFVDCNHFAIAPRMFDVAHYILHLVKWDTDAPERTAVWLEDFPQLLHGYDEVEPLTPHEKAALPCLLLVGPLLFMDGWLRNSDEVDPLELRAFEWLCGQREEIARRIAASGIR